MWRLQVQRGRCKWRQLRATVCTAGKLVSSRPRPWRHGCTKWQEWSRTQWHTIETMKWQNHWMPLGHFRFVKGKALQTCSGTFRTWLQRSRIYKAQNLIWRHAVTSSFAKRLDVFIDLKQLWRACDLLVMVCTCLERIIRHFLCQILNYPTFFPIGSVSGAMAAANKLRISVARSLRHCFTSFSISQLGWQNRATFMYIVSWHWYHHLWILMSYERRTSAENVNKAGVKLRFMENYSWVLWFLLVACQLISWRMELSYLVITLCGLCLRLIFLILNTKYTYVRTYLYSINT